MPLWMPPSNLLGMMELSLAKKGIAVWEQDNLDKVLNIGCGEKMIAGSTSLDLPEWDADKMDIPFDDETFTTIFAIHFLEHIERPVYILRELQRVLQVGGHLNIALPYYSAQAAYQDLDHKSFWCEETWRNTFNNPYSVKGHQGWRFRVGANFIIGLVERNMMLLTQLTKE